MWVCPQIIWIGRFITKKLVQVQQQISAKINNKPKKKKAFLADVQLTGDANLGNSNVQARFIIFFMSSGNIPVHLCYLRHICLFGCVYLQCMRCQIDDAFLICLCFVALCTCFVKLHCVRQCLSTAQLTSRMSHICVQVKTCSAGGYTVWRFLSSETKFISCGKDMRLFKLFTATETPCAVWWLVLSLV